MSHTALIDARRTSSEARALIQTSQVLLSEFLRLDIRTGYAVVPAAYHAPIS